VSARDAARYFLDLLASVCYQYEAVVGLRSKNRTKVKQLRVRAFGEVERLFGTSLVWEGAGSENGWQIGADKYVGLAAGAERFAKHLHSSLRGIYPSLSGYSHPSIRFIDEILSESQTSDGYRVANWHFDISAVDKQTRISAGILYRAATGLFSYVGGRQDLLESAMDRFEASVQTLTTDS
jgi:hypothetical protein